MSEYHQITLSEWVEMKNRLRRELNDLRTSFVRVGYILRKMEDSKAYEAEGYKSVAEFALKEHGLKPSTTSRWMAINREYSINGYSEQLDPRYLDMNASQLTEMLTLPDKDRELVTPETPRAEIRELKRFNADAAAADAQAAPEEKSPAGKAFELLLASDASTAEAVRNCLEHGLADAKHLFDAVAPSGSRMFRAGTVFLVFNQLNITVKVFGGENSSASYEEFAEAASEWFTDHGKPEESAPEADVVREQRNQEVEERLEKLALARERAEEEKKEEDRDEGKSEESENGEAGDDHDIREPEAGAPADEPEGDVCGDVEAPQGGTGEVIETVEAEIVEEPRVADISKIPPVMPKPADDTSDLMKKAENAYKAIGRAVEKAAWKKAATEVRKLLTYIEKLEDMEK